MIFLRLLNFKPKVNTLLYLIIITHASLTVIDAYCGSFGSGASKQIFQNVPECRRSDCATQFQGICLVCDVKNKSGLHCVLESVDMNVFYDNVPACQRTGCLTLGFHCKRISTVLETAVCEDTG